MSRQFRHTATYRARRSGIDTTFSAATPSHKAFNLVASTRCRRRPASLRLRKQAARRLSRAQPRPNAATRSPLALSIAP